MCVVFFFTVCSLGVMLWILYLHSFHLHAVLFCSMVLSHNECTLSSWEKGNRLVMFREEFLFILRVTGVLSIHHVSKIQSSL